MQCTAVSRVGLALLVACAALVGCSRGNKVEATTTSGIPAAQKALIARENRKAEAELAAERKDPSAEPPSRSKAAHLAEHKRSGVIVAESIGTHNLGPYQFKGGIYTVRFQQFVGSDGPEIDFGTEASSLVVQLDRQPGVIGADTVTVFNVTRGSGENQVTIPAGHFYVDVSSEDYGVTLRFTPHT